MTRAADYHQTLKHEGDFKITVPRVCAEVNKTLIFAMVCWGVISWAWGGSFNCARVVG